MGFIGSALGAVKDAVTAPFKHDDDQTADANSPRSTTSPDSSAHESGAFSLSAKPDSDNFVSSFASGLIFGGKAKNNAAPKPDNGKPTVAVIDDFNPTLNGDGGLNHGQAVESVVAQHDGKKGDIKRIQQDSTIEPEADDIDGQIEELGTTFLNRTTKSLKTAGRDTNIRTVNISSGLSRADVINNFMQNKSADEIAAELGLPAGLPPQYVAQALADHVDSVFDNSSAIQDAQAEYNQTTQDLDQRGVSVVIAAGNSGENVQFLKDNNIAIDEDTVGDNLLANNNVITVGASDGNNIASFSSSRTDVDVTADGTDVQTDQGGEDGTSFSAPQVTAAVAELKRRYPTLSNEDILALLKNTGTNTAADDALEGAGQINVDKAIRAGKNLSASQQPEAPSGAEKAGALLHNVFALIA